MLLHVTCPQCRAGINVSIRLTTSNPQAETVAGRICAELELGDKTIAELSETLDDVSVGSIRTHLHRLKGRFMVKQLPEKKWALLV